MPSSNLRRKRKGRWGADPTLGIETPESKAFEAPEKKECLEAEKWVATMFQQEASNLRNHQFFRFHVYTLGGKQLQEIIRNHILQLVAFSLIPAISFSTPGMNWHFL